MARLTPQFYPTYSMPLYTPMPLYMPTPLQYPYVPSMQNPLQSNVRLQAPQQPETPTMLPRTVSNSPKGRPLAHPAVIRTPYIPEPEPTRPIEIEVKPTTPRPTLKAAAPSVLVAEPAPPPVAPPPVEAPPDSPAVVVESSPVPVHGEVYLSEQNSWSATVGDIVTPGVVIRVVACSLLVALAGIAGFASTRFIAPQRPTRAKAPRAST